MKIEVEAKNKIAIEVNNTRYVIETEEIVSKHLHIRIENQESLEVEGFTVKNGFVNLGTFRSVKLCSGG